MIYIHLTVHSLCITETAVLKLLYLGMNLIEFRHSFDQRWLRFVAIIAVLIKSRSKEKLGWYVCSNLYTHNPAILHTATDKVYFLLQF